jgi:hypothetical protein
MAQPSTIKNEPLVRDLLVTELNHESSGIFLTAQNAIIRKDSSAILRPCSAKFDSVPDQ